MDDVYDEMKGTQPKFPVLATQNHSRGEHAVKVHWPVMFEYLFETSF